MIFLLILILMIFLANLPWMTSNFMLLFPAKKSLPIIVLEVLLYFLIFRLITYALEWTMIGSVHNQDWQFYAALLSLFIVSSSPGFVVKVLWK